MGVASGCGEQEVGVATGCCCKEVYRFPHITCPYILLLYLLFFQQHPYFLLIFKNAFILVVMIRSSRFTHNVIIQFRVCMCFPV